ncbi:MAG: GxxExxY protein [Caldilineaceae bacterium]
MGKLLHGDLTYYLRGISFQIHNELKGGHIERYYEEALMIALDADGVPYRNQPTFWVYYKGYRVGEYRPDFTVAEDRVILELKAQPAISQLHKAQVLSYLAVTDAELALIMNFGAPSMQFARVPNFLKMKAEQRLAFLPTINLPPNWANAELTHRILDGLCEVHQILGAGFQHKVYRRASHIELAQRGLDVQYIQQLPLHFRNTELGQRQTYLFHVEQKILLAAVALYDLTPKHTEVMRWAMDVLNCPQGMIANFYPNRLDVRYFRK